ncbi:MAG: hypothetical protein GC136_01980 [Alphaproteobacteria bacterium]|nr:hypothetical protein [Alphaproteobacteria bacterium]
MTTITYLPGAGSLDGTKIIKNGVGTQTPTETDAAREQYKKQREQFLQVLLTQLENQNPLDPVDPSEFTGQLAQYSSLEQLLNLNENFESLKEAMEVNSNASAFSYIGNSALLNTNMSAAQDGKATWNYTIDGDAKEAVITIRNSNNQKVYELTSNGLSKGTYKLDFDTAEALRDIAPGEVLTLSVQAKDAAGNSIKTSTTTTVRIDGIETDNGETYLRAGDLIFSFADIEKITSTISTTLNNGGAGNDTTAETDTGDSGDEPVDTEEAA